jgi:predicted SprT family Zn-dependent metalloprotease
MLVRNTLGMLVLIGAGWGIWTVFSARGSEAASSPARAADARQRELLKINIDLPAEPELAAMFAAVNAKHFQSALPATPIRWEPRLSEIGALAGGTFTFEGMFGHIGKRTAILLNPDLRPNRASLERALCHEMVHAYLFSVGDSTTTHGAPFQAVLRRLSEEGAFEGILADVTERTNLRAWLDAESARLDDEHAAMTQLTKEIEDERVSIERDVAELNARITRPPAEGGPRPGQPEIDAMNRRRDVYTDRANAAAARGERDNTDLAEFNRQVSRYNLMLVYPDGVDEDALLKPKPAPSRK